MGVHLSKSLTQTRLGYDALSELWGPVRRQMTDDESESRSRENMEEIHLSGRRFFCQVWKIMNEAATLLGTPGLVLF